MIPIIRVDEEVYQALQEQAEPFVDTPNSVLRRILYLKEKRSSIPTDKVKSKTDYSSNLHDSQKNVSNRSDNKSKIKTTLVERDQISPRLSSDGFLPQEEYELPILRFLEDMGGSAPSRDVIDGVGEALKSKFSTTDKQYLKSGKIRWKNRVQWARFELIKRGELEPVSQRGWWTISQRGKLRIRIDK